MTDETVKSTNNYTSRSNKVIIKPVLEQGDKEMEGLKSRHM